MHAYRSGDIAVTILIDRAEHVASYIAILLLSLSKHVIKKVLGLLVNPSQV